MNDTSPPWIEDAAAHVWQPYAQAALAPAPLPVSHTEGCKIVLTDGTRLIDGISSWWCLPHGHKHPALIEAAKRQLDVMPHVMFAGLTHEPAATLAARLSQITPGGGALARVFFSDSGSTAVEVALKMALQYHANCGQPQRNRFACLPHAYHGDTFGAMSVSDPMRGMHRVYGAHMPPPLVAEMPDTPEAHTRLHHWFAEHAGTLAALIVEPLVQGAGGMRFYSADTLRTLHALCTQHGVLLIADEIMTGFGRTGAMFACELAGIVPDILCVGKALTGGILTLAATLATERVYNAFTGDKLELALMHGPTYMANPLACAVANASLDLFAQEDRLGQVARIAAQIEAQLGDVRMLEVVRDVRIKGAIAAVQLDAMRFDAFAMRPRLWERGCWLRPFGDIVYLMPPFTIAESELSQLCKAVCSEIRQL